MDVKYLKYLCVWFVGHIRVKSWKKLICIHSKSGNVHGEVWINNNESCPSFNGRPCVTPQFCTIGLNGGIWAMPQFCTIVQNVSLPNQIIFGRKWSFFCNKHIAHIITKRREKSFLPKLFLPPQIDQFLGVVSLFPNWGAPLTFGATGNWRLSKKTTKNNFQRRTVPSPVDIACCSKNSTQFWKSENPWK